MKHDFKQTALKLAIVSAFSIGAAGLSINSYAANVTAELEVSATIAASCTISTTAVAFGAYDPIVANASVAQDGTGTVTTTCTIGSAAAVTLNQGSHPLEGSTDPAPVRQMAKGDDLLVYFLYSNIGRTTVWGNTTDVDVEANGTGEGLVLTVYGAVTPGQNKPAGIYADTVVANVTF